jgi:hypothetical protein
MSNKRSRSNSSVPPDVVFPSGIFVENPEVTTNLISTTKNTTNAEKLLRGLINETIRDYDVLKRSERDEAWDTLYWKFRYDGYDRMYETGQTKKREELFAIKAKALDYSNSIPQPQTDLTNLNNAEKAELESYKLKNLRSCAEFKEKLIQEEDHIIAQLNELNTKRFNNVIKQQYLKSVFEVLHSNVKASLIAECIDGFISDCGGNSFTINREQNLIIEDVKDTEEQQYGFGQMQITND